jgi:hypothetical protein
MSGNLIPREGDDPEDRFELIDVPEANQISQRRVGSMRNAIGGQLTGYVHEGEVEDTVVSPENESIEDGEYSLIDEDREVPMVKELDLSPSELMFFRQELNVVKPALKNAATVIGKLLALQKKGIRKGGTQYGMTSDRERYENLIGELRASADVIKDFVGHATQHWGYIRYIASNLPHGINLASDLEDLPEDFDERISEWQSSLDLLGVRQHVDMLTLTVRLLDKIMPHTESGMPLSGEDFDEAVRSVAGGMQMRVPGAGTVDIFQYDIVRDGLELARIAAERSKSSATQSDLPTDEDYRCHTTLATFYGHAGDYYGLSLEFMFALNHIQGTESIDMRVAQSEASEAVRAALEGRGDWPEAAKLALKHMDMLKRHMRPRMQFLAKQMPQIEAVGPLTRVMDAVKSLLRLS